MNQIDAASVLRTGADCEMPFSASGVTTNPRFKEVVAPSNNTDLAASDGYLGLSVKAVIESAEKTGDCRC